MLTLVRTNAADPAFIGLVKRLDAELAERDGEDHVFYAQFNKLQTIQHVLVAYQDGNAVACGAIKAFADDAMEVKRMYTLPEVRGQGVAAKLLGGLETWAAEFACSRCVLETGTRQVEAMALYKKCGYRVIPNYGPYVQVENSVCFEKQLL